MCYVYARVCVCVCPTHHSGHVVAINKFGKMKENIATCAINLVSVRGVNETKAALVV